MRVFFIAAALAAGGSAAACADASTASVTDGFRRTAPATQPAPATKPPKTTGSSPSGSAPAPPTAPPSPRDAGAPTAPPPGAEPGTCASPGCLAGSGLSGCVAIDSSGAVVSMGCEDGLCACAGGSDATFEADSATADEARDAFVASCGCQ